MKIGFVLLVICLTSVVAEESLFYQVQCTQTGQATTEAGNGVSNQYQINDTTYLSHFNIGFSSTGQVKFVIFNLNTRSLVFTSSPKNFSGNEPAFHSSGSVGMSLPPAPYFFGVISDAATSYCVGYNSQTSDYAIINFDSPTLGDILQRDFDQRLSVQLYQAPQPTPICGNGATEGAEECDGGLCCSVNCTFIPSGQTCRAANGLCDLSETCSGSSSLCPSDKFQSNTTVCRDAKGDCDSVETCDGSTAACPADTFQPSTKVCRLSLGPCDITETCDGSTAACPKDTFNSSSTVCRASKGPCDVEEKCSGSSSPCPMDGFKFQGQVCRPAQNSCDLVENCPGNSAQCPADLLSQSGPCYCARNPNTKPTTASAQYFCSPTNSTVYYQCLNGVYSPQSAAKPCGAGTSCGCMGGYTECSCGGNASPCVRTGTKLQCK